MQVKNIECQIAQAQLRRYLTGEEMPNAIVGDLETHLKHCPECMDAAQSLRESLKGALTSKITGKPEPEPPKPKPERRAVAQAAATAKAVVQTPADVLSAPDSDFKIAKPKGKGSNAKTLFYSGALALVLVLMSTVFKDPTSLFGPHADKFHKDTPPATTATEGGAQPATQSDQAPSTDATASGATVIIGAHDQIAQKTDPQATGQAATQGAPQTGQNLPSGPIETNGLIVADSVTGTTVVKTAPKKQDPKPGPTKGAARPQTKKKPIRKSVRSAIVHVKVYPPDK